jgi:IPT/TIG domain
MRPSSERQSVYPPVGSAIVSKASGATERPNPTAACSTQARANEDSRAGGLHAGLRALHAIRSRRLGRWQVPGSLGSVLRRVWVPVALSIFAVVLLLVSEAGVPQSTASAQISADSSAGPPLNQSASSFNPYLENASWSPSPDELSNVSGNATLPRITDLTVGPSFLYLLTFVEPWGAYGSMLLFDTGSYSPSAASAILESDGCINSCRQHLPIDWRLPTPVAVYGGAPITGDLIAVDQAQVQFGSQGILLPNTTTIFIAASSNNTTWLYASQSLGVLGSWYAINGETAIPGTAPQIAVQPDLCQVAVETETASNTVVTTFRNTCQIASHMNPPPGGLNGEQQDLAQVQGASPQAGPSGPEVYGVVPYEALANDVALVNGIGFSSVQSVTFGGVSAAINSVTPTNISVEIPPGSGLTHVQVEVGGIWSPTNCSNQFLYGPELASRTPQVSWVTPAVSPSNSLVTIYGYNFASTDYVLFGGVRAAPPTLTSSNTLQVTVPLDYGTVNVTVVSSQGLSSPVTCADQFHYAGAFLGALSPNAGWSPQTIALLGENFSSSASVYFGSTASSTVTFVSSTELKAVVPSGSGQVSVTVHQSGFTSNGATFQYTGPPEPQVLFVANDEGVPDSPVTIIGSNFSSAAEVFFGAVEATSTVISTREINATAPGQLGTVNVTVSQNSVSSSTVCSDEYTYRTSGLVLPPNYPFVGYLSSSRGVSGSMITLDGWNLAPNDTVFFGPMRAPYVNNSLSNGTELTVEVPLGFGILPVEVAPPDGGPFSVPNCQDYFDIVSPGDPPLQNLPARSQVEFSALSGPVLLTSVATLWVAGVEADELDLYELNDSAVVRSGVLTDVSSTLGSSIFTSTGDTELTIPGGTPGLVSGIWSTNALFLMVTTDQLGRTVLETLVWNGWGNMSEPYFVTPSVGAATDPQVALAPYDEVYATWVDEGSGSAELDEAVFSLSGVLIQGPSLVPGSSVASEGGTVSSSSLMVDPMGHPVDAWGESGVGTNSGIYYAAEYAPPNDVLSLVDSGWSKVVPADLEDFGQPGLSSFESKVNTTLTRISNQLAAKSWCPAARNISDNLYTNVTWLIDAPVVSNAGLDGSCHAVVGTRYNTILTDSQGLLTSNVYLSVESEWLLEAMGVATMPDPDWTAFGTSGTVNASWYQPDTTDTVTDSWNDVLTVSPTTTGPNTVNFQLWGNFPGMSNLTQTGTCTAVGSTDTPASYRETVFLNDSLGSKKFTVGPTTYLSSFTITNLTADQNATWSVITNVAFQTQKDAIDGCAGQGENEATNESTPNGWTPSIQLTATGKLTTGLDPSPARLYLSENSLGVSTEAQDSLSWQNTVNAATHLWINGSSGDDVAWTNPGYVTYDDAAGGTMSSAPNPLKSMELILRTNNTPPTWTPALDAAQVSSPSEVQTFSEGCSVSGAIATEIWTGTAGGITNLTTSTVTLTWDSTRNTSGWAELHEYEGGVLNVTGQVMTLPNGTAYQYTAEATGLDGWEIYNTTFAVQDSANCKSSQGTTLAKIDISAAVLGRTFEVPGVAPLFEQDAPYDSVTQQGGGATIAWQVPTRFLDLNGTHFLNGTLDLTSTNASAATFVIPLSSTLPTFTNFSQFNTNVESPTATTYAVNVTGLSLNNEYTATLRLNYSTFASPDFEGSGQLTFWYERDTSGDGLTDWEKQYGWEVTTTNVTGVTSNLHVTADPAVFATNGLVGDFVEKEYGLNPNTVDSAGSHMLDTWNLTFNLGAGGGVLPTGSDFEIWYENSTYKPFATSVEYSPGLYESGNPLSKNITNISAAGKVTSGDGAPWAARALWSYSALETFVTLPGVKNASWLRAIEGSWKGITTLTIEGKLSWGANPLAASTPGDGLPDGERVNPLYDVGLEFHSVYANQTSLATGTGYAVKIIASYYNDAGQYRQLDNYSFQGIVGNATAPTVSNYVTTLPVSQYRQTQTISLEVVANESSGLKALPISGSQTEVNVSFDLAKGGAQTVSVTGTGSSGHATLYGQFQEVPMGVKAPTWLWVPTDNATVNSLPIGLQRYTGEQSFDLVVVNASASVTSDPIPLPWGGTANGITLSAGMNDFLVPREQFLYSPLGQAIFLGKNTSYNASAGAPPLVGSTEQGYVTGFDGANLMVDLGAYWQNRAITSGPGNITGSTETGTPAGNPLEVQVMAASSATDDNTGGLPSDPALYSTVGDPSALQSIVTLNITSTATLDLLLASLIDNTTGGSNAVNGTLGSVTYQVGFLGLNAAVVNAISNATEPSDGLYGAPSSHFPPPPPPSGWGALWNAVTSFATNPLGTVLSLASVAWNEATAAFTYLNHLAHEAVAIGAEVVARTAAAIVHVGQLFANALNALLNWIIEQITKLLSPVISPLTAAMRSWGGSLWSGFQTLWSEYNSSPSDVNGGLAATFLEGLFGSLFDVLLGISVAVAVALTVIQVIGLGADAVVNTILTLIPPPSQLAGYALSAALIPDAFFSSGLVSTGWDIYNSSTKSPSPFFAPLLAVVAGGVAAIRLSSTVPEAIQTVEYLSQTASSTQLVFFEPIVATVTGLLAIALSVVAHVVGGSEGVFLGHLGLIIAACGAVFATFVTLRYWSDLKDANQLDEQLIGLGLDGVGIAAGLAAAEL